MGRFVPAKEESMDVWNSVRFFLMIVAGLVALGVICVAVP
jgi:hypothetical protein